MDSHKLSLYATNKHRLGSYMEPAKRIITAKDQDKRKTRDTHQQGLGSSLQDNQRNEGLVSKQAFKWRGNDKTH